MKNNLLRLNSVYLKNILLAGCGLAVFLLMIFNIKENFVANQAVGKPPVNVAAQPANVSVNLTQDSNFTVNFNINGQKVTAVELFLNYDPAYIEYFKEYNTASGLSEIKDPGKDNYFDVPLIEEVTTTATNSKQLKVVLISKFNDPANPAWATNVTLNFKFRAKQQGNSAILINKTLSTFAGLTSTGEPTYFDPPVTDIQAMITITGTTTTTPTITPTTTPNLTPTATLTTAPTATTIPTTPTPTLTITPTRPITGTPTVTPNTTITPTRTPTPPFTVCDDDDDKDRDDAAEDAALGVQSVSAMDSSSKRRKKFDLLFIPEGYKKVEDFETDVKEMIAEFKDMKLSKRVKRKINFITYLDLTESNEIKQCDPKNGKKQPCWNKKKAKKTMRECDADGYMIVVNVPKANENPTAAREALEYWGKRTRNIWALGGGEALILRYDLKAVREALALAIVGSLDKQTAEMWEKALEKFIE